jgi:hypothetical protein
MARILERSVIEKELQAVNKKISGINWEYISPNIDLISDEYDFVFKNYKEEVSFSFYEIYSWIYDENYIGCSGNCERCLTPIC